LRRRRIRLIASRGVRERDKFLRSTESIRPARAVLRPSESGHHANSALAAGSSRSNRLPATCRRAAARRQQRHRRQTMAIASVSTAGGSWELFRAFGRDEGASASSR
jgi:hypothetical protein